MKAEKRAVIAARKKKTCTLCRKVKPLDEFHRKRSMIDGRQSTCKTCVSARTTVFYQKNRARIKASVMKYNKKNRDQIERCRSRKQDEAKQARVALKIKKQQALANRKKKPCPTCRKTKSIKEFHVDNHKADGRAILCKKCIAKKAAIYYKKNSRRLKKYYADKAHRDLKENPARFRAKRMTYHLNSVRKRGVHVAANLDLEFLEQLVRDHPRCECCNQKLILKGKEVSSGLGKDGATIISIDRVLPSRGYTRDNIAILCMRCNRLKNDAKLEELEKLTTWLRTRTCGK